MFYKTFEIIKTYKDARLTRRALYRDIRQKVQLTIAEAFGISASLLHLTKPTFFSRINSTEAQTAHDEYWHAHVDKVRVWRVGARSPGDRDSRRLLSISVGSFRPLLPEVLQCALS